MSAMIKVLDRHTIDRIAAGEVIERPASVVKELLENALDAGATRIDIEVKGGGCELIRVADNGGGIPAGETALAFERHATSKIRAPDDLFDITSLGFRGEALPSIAAVADLELVTQADGEPHGTALFLEAGTIVRREDRARSRGTSIAVRNLFRVVPARLKFLKSSATENGRIATVVTSYALAWPEVAFSLTVEGKENLRTSGRGRLEDVVAEVYDTKTASRMLSVENSAGVWRAGEGESIVTVSGLAGAPEVTRTGRGHLNFFVNRRWVISRTLSFAVEEAYQGLLMTGRHPVAVLNIAVPPMEVDVNIHPAKSEVKFRHEQDVFRAVQQAVRRALTGQMSAPALEGPALAGIEEPLAPFTALRDPQASQPSFVMPRTMPPERTTEAIPFSAALPALRVLGQVMSAYILAEGPDGIYLIDQHAAHERVRYDTLMAQRAARKPEVQGLLEPGTLEVTPRQQTVLDAVTGTLADLGFRLEPFGERAYLVRAVPAHLTECWREALRELLDELSGEPKNRWEERAVASIACHNAVRSGQVLSMEEMQELVRQLEVTANPHTCPHGRPTMIKLGRDYIERHFGRD